LEGRITFPYGNQCWLHPKGILLQVESRYVVPPAAAFDFSFGFCPLLRREEGEQSLKTGQRDRGKGSFIL